MDEYQLKLVRDALKSVERYKADPNGFMKQLTSNQFYVGNKQTIWDHFGVLTSLSPSFAEKYRKTVLTTYKVPNKKFWNDYVGKIENFLYYMAQVPGEQSVILDKALQSFASAGGGLTAEQLAYMEQMRSMPVQQRLDMIDKMVQSKPGPKKPYYGSVGPSKGIQGSKSIINERKAGIQGAKPLFEERKVLTVPEEEPLKVDMETFSSNDYTSSTPSNTFPSQNQLNFTRQILHPPEKIREGITEAEHIGKMGVIKGKPRIIDAANTFGREFLRELNSIPILSGPEKETIVYDSPQETTSRSTGGGRFSVGPRNIRTITNVPKTIRRTRQGVSAARLAGTVARQVATKNPWVLLTIIILVVILVLFFLTSDNFHIIQNTALCGLPDQPCGRTPSQTVETQNVVTILKTGPANVVRGDDIPYNVSVTYTGPGVADLQMTDTAPTGTTLLSYFPNDPATSQRNGDTVTWTINNIASNTPQIFFLTVTAPDADVWVQNTATVRVISTSITPGVNTPPNQDNCNGRWGPNSYFGRFPQNGNFGDPNCDFTRDALMALLRIDDPLNADTWFNVVVRCESGYDPNAFAAVSTSGTAWGLYQMNRTGHSTTGPNDVGDVVWQLQTSNAVATLQYIIAHGFSYRGIVGFPAYWQSTRPGECL